MPFLGHESCADASLMRLGLLRAGWARGRDPGETHCAHDERVGRGWHFDPRPRWTPQCSPIVNHAPRPAWARRCSVWSRPARLMLQPIQDDACTHERAPWCPSTGQAGRVCRESPGGVDRPLARGLPRSRGARTHAPDDRCGHRRDRRPDDPDRRQVARRLRVVQLPRLRSGSDDHRRDPGVHPPVGHASELVAAARQPCPLRTHRGSPDRAPRLRRHAHPPDDHADPHVGDPDPRRQRHDLHREPRA